MFNLFYKYIGKTKRKISLFLYQNYLTTLNRQGVQILAKVAQKIIRNKCECAV